MTRILRCDRCGFEARWVASPVCRAFPDDLSDWRQMLDFDICPRCVEAFRRDFMGAEEPVDRCQRTLDGADEPWNCGTEDVRVETTTETVAADGPGDAQEGAE